MDPNVLFLDRDQVKRQVKTSRSVVEARAIQVVSVESLQALILVVFDHVSDAHQNKRSALDGRTRSSWYPGHLMAMIAQQKPTEDVEISLNCTHTDYE
jgi:hypothetical protein